MRILFVIFMLCFAGLPAVACEIDGDSIALALSEQMPECDRSAQNGISSMEVVGRVRGGEGLVIASAGSNDTRRLRVVQPSLDAILSRSRGHLLLILPSNGARGTVAAWAARHHVRTVSFVPDADGIHPRDYGALAARVRGMAR